MDKISKLKGVFVECFVFATTSDSESLPLNRFYRYKFDVEPSFQNGYLAESFMNFDGMPKKSLLTLGMDVPGPWLIRPQKSIYDLDNIKLEEVDVSLDAVFTLQYILVQGNYLLTGHAKDESNAAPRGLQFVLSTLTERVMVDTITMANLGYFQLKGDPGVFKLEIRKGRSDQVYELMEINPNSPNSKLVVCDSFEGITLYPLVKKRKGMEDADVLIQESNFHTQWTNVKNRFY